MYFLDKYSMKLVSKINTILIKRGHLPLSKKDAKKVIKINTTIWFWIWIFAKTIFFTTLFTKIIFDRLGFEKTIVLLITLIFIKFWFNSVKK